MTPRRWNSTIVGALAIAVFATASAPCSACSRQDGAKPNPDSAPPKQAHPGASKRNPSERSETGFEPGRSVWGRFTAREVPKDVKEPTADELAAKLGLVSIGPQGPDAIVEYREPRTSMLFVFVPGGTFPMGANYGDIYNDPLIRDAAMRGKADQEYFGAEQPQTPVYVSSFFVGVYEVTNGEYRQFLDAWRAGKLDPACEWPLPHAQPNHVPYLWERPDYPFWGDRQPVVGVTWLDGWAMARWMGGRLPTEAEWEKAARSTDGRKWPWGNHFDPQRLNSAEAFNRHTTDVGTYPGGRSPYGCFDMAGNVAEMCLDSYEPSAYRYLPLFNPCLVEREPILDRRACRGSRWTHFGLLYTTRCTARGQTKLDPKFPDPSATSKDSTLAVDYLGVGFRVVLTPNVDPFPDGAVAHLTAEYEAAAEKMRQARAEKAAEQAKNPKRPGGRKKPAGESKGDANGDGEPDDPHAPSDDHETPAPHDGGGGG